MKTRMFQKRKQKRKSNAGFTLLEMVIVAALVSIFFTMAAFIIPVWYRMYDKAVNINYARQIANSVLGAVEQQIRFADDVQVINADGADPVQRLTGKARMARFTIPMEDTANLIDGLVYDEDFFIHNDIALKFDMSADRSYCTVSVTVTRDGEKILEKTRAVMLSGENGGTS